jgi:hypothetical protein
MKLHVVFNKDGDILAAVQLASGTAVRARPVADEQAGHRTADVYVPEEYRHFDLATVCQRMKVDVKGKFADLTAKSRSCSPSAESRSTTSPCSGGCSGSRRCWPPPPGSPVTAR